MPTPTPTVTTTVTPSNTPAPSISMTPSETPTPALSDPKIYITGSDRKVRKISSSGNQEWEIIPHLPITGVNCVIFDDN